MKQPSNSDEQLAALLAAPPPREVPVELRRTAFRQAAPLRASVFLTGGFIFLIFIFGNTFPWRILDDLRLDRAAASARGNVLFVTRTGVVAGGNRNQRGTPVYQYDFTFRLAGSTAINQGACYTTGQRWNPGDHPEVQYLLTDPSVARLVGARLSKNDRSGVIMIVFPILAVVFAAAFVVNRRRVGRILTHGSVAEANVTGCEEYRTGRNRRIGYRITLRRTGDPNATPWIVKSTQPKVMALARDRLASKQPVFVMYDPEKPKRALLPESLVT